MISFIGYYNYTVILTYISLFCSIAGMLFTVTSCGKEVSDQTIAATEQSSEERRVLFVMARV